MNKQEKILVTGSAGFIGFHLVEQLIIEKYEIVGLDIINDYYDINLKYDRLFQHGILKEKINLNQIQKSQKYNNYSFVKADLKDHNFILTLMENEKFDYVINLAAQAGVRYSLINPKAYIDSNIDGFISILEGCRHSNVKHLIYASTSSVYGLNTTMPLSESLPSEHPISLYSATKKANELMAHSYSHLFNIPTTGLRFFTVYGPWGRPDMALFLFIESMINKKPIKIFNFGKMVRDFTYVEDIVLSISKLINKMPTKDLSWDPRNPTTSSSSAPFKIFNIGNSNPVSLMKYIQTLEESIGIKAIKEFYPLQDGDVPETHADVSALEDYIGYRPNTSIEDGINYFVKWYLNYYKIN